MASVAARIIRSKKTAETAGPLVAKRDSVMRSDSRNAIDDSGQSFPFAGTPLASARLGLSLGAAAFILRSPTSEGVIFGASALGSNSRPPAAFMIMYGETFFFAATQAIASALSQRTLINRGVPPEYCQVASTASLLRSSGPSYPAT